MTHTRSTNDRLILLIALVALLVALLFVSTAVALAGALAAAGGALETVAVGFDCGCSGWGGYCLDVYLCRW